MMIIFPSNASVIPSPTTNQENVLNLIFLIQKPTFNDWHTDTAD